MFIKLTNSTESLQHDHVFIKRVKDIVHICSTKLYNNQNIPIEDIEIISVIIEEFIDKFHHNKEKKAISLRLKIMIIIIQITYTSLR